MPRNANEEFQRLKKLGDKVADELTRFAGSMTFVYVHTFCFAVWITINLGGLGLGLAVDKYPFGLLTLIVSLEVTCWHSSVNSPRSLRIRFDACPRSLIDRGGALMVVPRA